MKKKNVVIISNLLGGNRQGFDLALLLRSLNYQVKLVQYADKSDPSSENYGVGYIYPKGTFSKFIVLWNIFRIFKRSFLWKKDIVVCIGRILLPVAAFYKFFFGVKLIYYSLEYTQYRGLSRWILKNLVDRYIDVEENRLAQVRLDTGILLPSIVLNNRPTFFEVPYRTGILRTYLRQRHGISADAKLVIYAGSYQRYSKLENIIHASDCFDENTYLILMVSWGLPEMLKGDCSRCIMVPPVIGSEFYMWLADADCALLPYENDGDFNVRNCSPQKLFDCFMVGLPFVASARPIIRKTLECCPDAGELCDFRDLDDIVRRVRNLLMTVNKSEDREKLAKRMRALSRNSLNYGAYRDVIGAFFGRL